MTLVEKGQWCVYLLLCRDNSVYCGITNDLFLRLFTHNKGKGAKYTRSRLPVILIYAEKAKDKSAALKRELQIKAMPRRQKLNLMVRD
jgi:predicted GIY-YIG superfamily endonuclease